jgi:hypothetical protein
MPLVDYFFSLVPVQCSLGTAQVVPPSSRRFGGLGRPLLLVNNKQGTSVQPRYPAVKIDSLCLLVDL